MGDNAQTHENAIHSSKTSITDLLSNVKDDSGYFFKYIPDSMLNEARIESKKTAILEDEAKIAKMREETAVKKTELEKKRQQKKIMRSSTPVVNTGNATVDGIVSELANGGKVVAGQVRAVMDDSSAVTALEKASGVKIADKHRLEQRTEITRALEQVRDRNATASERMRDDDVAGVARDVVGITPRPSDGDGNSLSRGSFVETSIAQGEDGNYKDSDYMGAVNKGDIKRDNIISLTQDEFIENCKALVTMDAVVELSGIELSGNASLKEKIEFLFNSFGNNVHTERFGEVALSKSSIRSDIRHGSTKAKVAAYAAIPDVLRKGVVIDVRKKNYGEVERIIVAAPIKIAEVPYAMGVMIQRDKNSQRLYLHDVVIKKEASAYQPKHLNTTGSLDSENLFTTEVLEKALSVGYSILHKENKVKSGIMTRDSASRRDRGENPERIEARAETSTSDFDRARAILVLLLKTLWRL